MKLGKKMMRMTMPLKHTVLINSLGCFVCGMWATALWCVWFEYFGVFEPGVYSKTQHPHPC